MAGTVVVVGGGQAAAALISHLRAIGDGRPVVLVSDEPVPPYQRPPLSKAYLLGKIDQARLLFRPERWYAENGVTLRLGRRAVAIDRAARTVRLDDGSSLDYEALALVTGSTPRRLPEAMGGHLAGVHVVRGLADVDAMAGEFQPGRRLLVVGGGYIGLEAAAVAAARGLRVTILEAAGRILQRVAAPETADYFRALHESHGVTVREGTPLGRLAGRDGRVTGASFGDGEHLEVDFVIAGIGIRPNDALARDAGLAVEDGIVVDRACRTSDPAIVAAGDCARVPWEGGTIRLESVQNAVDQAEAAAETLAGRDAAYHPFPWFWSDQFDVKLQIAGLAMGHDHVVDRKSVV